MQFACYTDWDQLPSSAARLFDDGAKLSLFLSLPWFENLAVHAAEPGRELLLACVVDRDNVLAALPLWTHSDGSWHALSNHFTSLFSVLLADDDRRATLDCMAEGLAGLPFRSLRIEPVAAEDPAISRLQQAMERHGFEGQRYFHFVNWYQPLQGQSYAQYLAQRPARLRNTIARKSRKLQREHGYEIRLYTGEDLETAVTDYNTVYRASWKAGERFPEFVPALIRTAAASGWLRLALLYIAGRPAAGQIWFVVHGKASIFRLAYDEHWQRYSPGSILTAYLMERVIDDDRAASIDFLTGNEHYKQDWLSERRERWRLVLVKRPQPEDSGRSLSRLLKRYIR
jgi:ribosomal protein S18 acetylase RimI-like enzyme